MGKFAYEVLTFYFRVLPLWKFDARFYFEKRILGMYAFLPAMGGVTRNMLFEALDRMVQYYRDQGREDELREELLAFGILLRRAAILPLADIEEVTRKITMIDPLILEDSYYGPIIREKIAQAEIRAKEQVEVRAKELAEVRAKELAEASSKASLIRIVEARFPDLGARAAHEAVLPESYKELDALIVQVAIAPDEEAARQLLGL